MKDKTICRQRKDLNDVLIPYIEGDKSNSMELVDWTYCEQPDELENDEYNVKVALPNMYGNTAYFMSIDLEFKTITI